MSIYNNNNNDEEIVAVLTWNSTRKTSVYNPIDLQYMRKSSGNGTGFKYYNSHRDTYEFPRSVTLIPKSKLTAIETKSASITSSKNNDNNNNNKRVPAHLRLHQILSGGPGFSVRV